MQNQHCSAGGWNNLGVVLSDSAFKRDRQTLDPLNNRLKARLHIQHTEDPTEVFPGCIDHSRPTSRCISIRQMLEVKAALSTAGALVSRLLLAEPRGSKRCIRFVRPGSSKSLIPNKITGLRKVQTRIFACGRMRVAAVPNASAEVHFHLLMAAPTFCSRPLKPRRTGPCPSCAFAANCSDRKQLLS